MGFGGSTSGANVSLKNNRREKRSKIEKFQKTTGSKIQGIKSEKVNVVELEKIRKKLTSEHQKKRRRTLLITSLIFVVLLTLFWFLMF